MYARIKLQWAHAFGQIRFICSNDKKIEKLKIQRTKLKQTQSTQQESTAH